MKVILIEKRILYGLFFIILTLTIQTNLLGQNLKKVEKKAIRSFDKGNYVEARDQFQNLYESEWNINSTASYLAQCYLQLYEPAKSRMVLRGLSNPNQENLYLLIISNYFTENFEEADRLIAGFQDTARFNVEEFEDRLSGASAKYQNSNGYLIQNFGSEINTPNREYSAIMYNDFNKLLFTSRKESSSLLGQDGLDYEMIYSTSVDSLNNWNEAEPLNMEVNKDRSHDATVQVYSSGNKMISYHDGNLYSLSLKDGKWVRDGDLAIKDFNGTNTHCFITSDEQTIFFASDFTTNGEHLDLFVIRKQPDGDWSDPEPMMVFNTEFDEDAPFLAGDGTFYFSSRGHNSMGGYDVFKSTYDSVSNTWNAPENLGHPINTVAEDIYYTTDGKLGYISSTRVGGYGSLDIYRVFLFNKVKVNGRLLDNNNQPIGNAEIDIKYDSTHLKSYTDRNGNYEFFVPIQKKMQVKFIKDSLNLVEGEYIVNVFFEDENHNEFNFYIDYADEKPELVDGKEDPETVRHINVEVRNDYSENLMIASVPPKEENQWSDSLNTVDAINKRNDVLKREVTQSEQEQLAANDQFSDVVDISSSNLNIHEAVITRNVADREPTPTTTEATEATPDQDVFTVQILALYRLPQPSKTFFNKLGSNVTVQHKQGKDGFDRYYTGEYQTWGEAIKAMRSLRTLGYDDAFVRSLKMYKEL